MRSSTSSSESRIAAALLFVASFAGMYAAGHVLPRGVRDDVRVWRAAGRLDDSWLLTYRDGHYAAYWDEGEFLAGARRADVLLLGNSRASFAFRQELVQPFAERTGVRIFDLTFGYHETYFFPLRVIEKHALRPRLVIVNADDFFSGRMSPLGRRVLAGGRVPEGGEGRWPYLRYRFEDELTSRVQGLVHQWVPRWGGVLPSGPTPTRIHRSRHDGSWDLGRFDLATSRRPIPSPRQEEPPVLSPRQLDAIAELRGMMARRNTAVVVTLVPHPGASRAHARSVADALGAPLVAPWPDGLETTDGSHLTAESARRFAAAFFVELEELPVFRQLLEAR